MNFTTLQRWALGSLLFLPSLILLRVAEHIGALKPHDPWMFCIFGIICVLMLMFPTNKIRKEQ